MVEPTAEGETLAQIADRYGRAYNTIRNKWARHDAWPAPIDKRGRHNVYDPAAVDQAVRKHFIRPAAELQPRRLYTAREIEETTGVTAATIRADVSKGRWPAPDDTSGRAHRWYGQTVMTAVNARRGYRRSTEA
ncbi:helix-turn-helix transcriptional regulator [Streptomyces sp. BH034]|uniref:helix-turn-helix transcriptional regulator n=1 Tax=Streptomyces sp. BH034 TaxID=3402626 RepID=UPI003BB620DD